MPDIEEVDPELAVNASDVDDDEEEVFEGGGDDDGEEDENEEDGEDGPPDEEEDEEDEEDEPPDEEKEHDKDLHLGGATSTSNPNFHDESHFVETMLGGAAPEEEEELSVVRNKKIVHHDEVMLLHPESSAHNYDEIQKASIVTRNENNIIVDKLHTSMPILTKYERAKILGQRTKQLNEGSEPFITWDRPTMDNSLIAEEELMQKKLPFIIQRPMPNGGFEYWHVKDLEVIRDM
jgi:DNA-directed RNA polymerase subunit K/omega